MLLWLSLRFLLKWRTMRIFLDCDGAFGPGYRALQVVKVCDNEALPFPPSWMIDCYAQFL